MRDIELLIGNGESARPGAGHAISPLHFIQEFEDSIL